ncbi:MAG: hypothetical protein IT443_00810 [Phycisphaeraceae bacterium]|nr:hypothetical protein [Phycisphaeraceae bacterium]
MIEETNAFLTWALSQERHLPRIPTRPVAQGGFANLLAHPGARRLAARWWANALKAVGFDA